ncbi:putative galactosamine-6-phosphate isomerase [Maribacter sp. HTCC2170]|nr:putative galactosamine-6-phosphate isomerase [Maribacter sp. HTCC2170]
MGQKATSMVIDEVTNNPQLLLCAATGSSPLPLYQRLGEESKKNTTLFKQIRILPLDEWIGLPSSDGTCDSFIHEHLLTPLKVSKERYFPFNPLAENLEAECLRIQAILKKQGPLDLCILGLGKNGHLGFNEPTKVLKPHCHIADLTTQSQQHTMILGSSKKPTQGITLGMQDILSSKRILLLVSGIGKEEAKEQLLSGRINSQWPASFLWKHDNVDCLVVR